MAYLTYFDVVEHLIAASFGGPQDAEQRDIRTAVHRCYTELSHIRDWSWSHVHGRIVTEAPQTLTTSSFNGVTLVVSGSVNGSPSHVRVGNVVAEVKAVASVFGGSSVTLGDRVRFPFGSVGSGETATFFRTTYALPDDFRNMDEPSDEFNWWSGAYVTPDEAMKMERVNFQSGSPLHWTVIKSPTSASYLLKLVGYPTSAETIDFTYRRSLRPLRWSGHEAQSRVGTVSFVVGGSFVVTGNGTQFDSSMVGSVLRVGTAGDAPGPLESITPYVTERAILTRSNATSLTVEGGAVSYNDVKYLITDPIDLPSHMHNCMLSGSEYWLARIRGSKVEEKYSLYQRDLRLAMESDQLAPISGRSKRIWHDGGWRSPLLADNFDFGN